MAGLPCPDQHEWVEHQRCATAAVGHLKKLYKVQNACSARSRPLSIARDDERRAILVNLVRPYIVPRSLSSIYREAVRANFAIV